MKLTQFIILGLCLAILTSTAGATEIYFGHMATRVIVEHDGVEKNFQDIITFNLLSAPAYRGCGNNECITGYTGISADGNENVDFMNLEPICTAIQHINE